jgi:hypothetical protein
MAPSSFFCVSLFSDFEEMMCASRDDHNWRRKCKELEREVDAMVLLRLLVAQDDDLQDKLMKRSRVKLSQGIIGLFIRLCAYGEMIVELNKSPLPCKSCDALLAENKLVRGENLEYANDVGTFLRENEHLNLSLANLQSEIDSLKSNASMPCNSCVALNDELDMARSKIAFLESSVSVPCVSRGSLLAKINNLKLTQTTCVDELEHARAEICDMKSMPCSRCYLFLVEDACHTSCDDDDALRDVNDVAFSCDLVCTSCINLESEVLALKKMCEDMSAKLVEHDEMSANIEKENELLRTTYAKCIEEEINNLRNMTCGTCEHLKSQNEVLHTRCKSLCAKGLDSHFSCHSDVDVSNFLLLNWSRLPLLNVSLWMVVSVLVLWIAFP